MAWFVLVQKSYLFLACFKLLQQWGPQQQLCSHWLGFVLCQRELVINSDDTSDRDYCWPKVEMQLYANEQHQDLVTTNGSADGDLLCGAVGYHNWVEPSTEDKHHGDISFTVRVVLFCFNLIKKLYFNRLTALDINCSLSVKWLEMLNVFTETRIS